MVARKPRMRKRIEDKVGVRGRPKLAFRAGPFFSDYPTYAHSIATKHSKLTMSQGILNLKE